jgi:4-hydroxybenzoate polyprenyltransferase
MRPRHWIKNGLIFMPALFAGRLFERQILSPLLAGLAAYCVISSAVYIFNDMLDASSDRLHVTKRLRPIASGAVQPWQGMALAAALTALGGWLVFLAGADAAAWVVIALYTGLHVVYSLGAKNIPLLDLIILAAGFFLRVLFGSVLNGIHLWLGCQKLKIAGRKKMPQ